MSQQSEGYLISHDSISLLFIHLFTLKIHFQSSYVYWKDYLQMTLAISFGLNLYFVLYIWGMDPYHT